MKKKIFTIVEALIVFLLIFITTVYNSFSSLDYIMKDNLYQVPRGVTSRIKIIAIDEETLEEYGPIGTWSRSIYGDLIDKLCTDEYAPYVIGFDIIFSGNVDEEGDISFAEKAGEYGNVVVASQYVYSEKVSYDNNNNPVYPIENEIYPYEALRENTDFGFTNFSLDSDGCIRRIFTYQDYNGEKEKYFPRLVYENYCIRAGIEIEEPVMDMYGRSLINYSGKPGYYEVLSMRDVLDGKLDPAIFNDSIVLVGAYAPGMQDNYNVPNGGSRQMYGVEGHANILQSYIQGRFAVNGDPKVFGIIFGLMGALLYLIIRRSRVWLATLTLILGIAAQIVIGVILNNKGICVSIFYMPAVLLLFYVYYIALKYFTEYFGKRKVLNAFKKYVAPEIVEEIAKKGDFSIKLGGENKDIAVLFVDIRGFTTMSEALEPEQVVDILNRYLALTTQSIFKNKGTLDKFVGDATMAVFNSPFDLDDYVYRAVRTALDIVAGGEAIEKEFIEKYGKSVGFGVGVHCGEAVVGNVGCDFRMDFTAIGDTVNTAARLEANAKRGQVLISDEVKKRLEGRIETEDIGNIPLKGKSNGIFVYSVKDLK